MVLSRLLILRNWRRYVDIVAKAIREVCPDVEIYLVGGAAEDRLTILSDIDILVVLPHEPSHDKVIELRTRILEKAEELGLPLYAPIELHIVGPETWQRYGGTKIRIENGVATPTH